MARLFEQRRHSAGAQRRNDTRVDGHAPPAGAQDAARAEEEDALDAVDLEPAVGASDPEEFIDQAAPTKRWAELGEDDEAGSGHACCGGCSGSEGGCGEGGCGGGACSAACGSERCRSGACGCKG